MARLRSRLKTRDTHIKELERRADARKERHTQAHEHRLACAMQVPLGLPPCRATNASSAMLCSSIR